MKNICARESPFFNDLNGLNVLNDWNNLLGEAMERDEAGEPFSTAC
jgi:hypothetical protein